MRYGINSIKKANETARKSRIRADKIMQIEKNLIINAFARLDNKIYDSLNNEINELVKRS